MEDNYFNFHSKTVGKNGMNASFDLQSGDWRVKQDVSHFKNEAKKEREKEEYFGLNKKSQYRKFATIPDIVALKLLEDHDLDLHHPDFMQHPANLKKLKRIIMSEYPELVVNK
jgi:hypothetical protein